MLGELGISVSIILSSCSEEIELLDPWVKMLWGCFTFPLTFFLTTIIFLSFAAARFNFGKESILEVDLVLVLFLMF